MPDGDDVGLKKRVLSYRIRFVLCGCLLGIAIPGLSSTTATPLTPAPAFELPGIGESVSLDHFRGSVVYVDFWASWCAPCRKSFPWMNQLHSQYEKKGLKIVAINLDQISADASEFLRDTQPDFAIAFDTGGQSARDYQVKGMPSSYVIDRNGNLLWRHIGFRKKDTHEIERQITAALERSE